MVEQIRWAAGMGRLALCKGEWVGMGLDALAWNPSPYPLPLSKWRGENH